LDLAVEVHTRGVESVMRLKEYMNNGLYVKRSVRYCYMERYLIREKFATSDALMKLLYFV